MLHNHSRWAVAALPFQAQTLIKKFCFLNEFGIPSPEPILQIPLGTLCAIEVCSESWTNPKIVLRPRHSQIGAVTIDYGHDLSKTMTEPCGVICYDELLCPGGNRVGAR
jgi:hypothetical protein